MSTYQPIGSLVGVTHSKSESKSAYSRLSGATYHENIDAWSGMTEEEKSIYLAEEHECTHHLLLSATSAGLLEWRIAQVWHRDLSWVARELTSLGLETPRTMNLADWLNREGHALVLQAMKEAHGEQGHRRIEYLMNVVEELENAIFIEDILFEYSHQPKSKITRREFCDAFNRWNTWASKRSGLSIGLSDYPDQESFVESDHVKRISSNHPDKPLFSPDSFNIKELIEAHATCQELWILEQHGDAESAQQLLKERLDSPQGNALRELQSKTASGEWQIGFSPSISMLAVLTLLNTPLDITMVKGEKAYTLEQILPWLAIESIQDLRQIDTDAFMDVCENLERTINNPVIGPHSQWVKYPVIETSLSSYLSEYGHDGLSEFLEGLTSHDVNRAIYTQKKAIQLTIEMLLRQLQSKQTASEALAKWSGSVRELLTLIEYTDKTMMFGKSITESTRPLSGRLGLLEDYRLVILGIILGSSQFHLSRAYWYGFSLPHPEILLNKISDELNDPEFSNLCNSIIPLYDRQVRHVYRNTFLDREMELYCKQ